MSRQILFCVESNNKARTDYQYIEETLKRFYKVDRKIRYRAIYLGSKTKYNAKDKVREINKNIKTFIKKNKVFSALIVMAIIIALVAIFAPVLAPYSPYDTKKLYDDIEIYCKKHGYEFVFFHKDVEDVYLGNSVKDKEKVSKVAEFKRKKMIENVDEFMLRMDYHKRHCSNILKVLDKYWQRK